jgi:hypothetical protein
LLLAPTDSESGHRRFETPFFTPSHGDSGVVEEQERKETDASRCTVLQTKKIAFFFLLTRTESGHHRRETHYVPHAGW